MNQETLDWVCESGLEDYCLQEAVHAMGSMKHPSKSYLYLCFSLTFNIIFCFAEFGWIAIYFVSLRCTLGKSFDRNYLPDAVLFVDPKTSKTVASQVINDDLSPSKVFSVRSGDFIYATTLTLNDKHALVLKAIDLPTKVARLQDRLGRFPTHTLATFDLNDDLRYLWFESRQAPGVAKCAVLSHPNGNYVRVLFVFFSHHEPLTQSFFVGTASPLCSRKTLSAGK